MFRSLILPLATTILIAQVSHPVLVSPRRAIFVTQGTNPALQTELKAMSEAGQEVRRNYKPGDKDLLEAVQQVDAHNETRLREVIKAYGWPTSALIGTRGVYDCFGIVQHGTKELRKECFPLIKAAWERGDILGEQLALLIDRILAIDEKGKQLYGSQFEKKPDGSYDVMPIEDETHLDDRRKAMGMIPFTEYKARLNKMTTKH